MHECEMSLFCMDVRVLAAFLTRSSSGVVWCVCGGGAALEELRERTLGERGRAICELRAGAGGARLLLLLLCRYTLRRFRSQFGWDTRCFFSLCISQLN